MRPSSNQFFGGPRSPHTPLLCGRTYGSPTKYLYFLEVGGLWGVSPQLYNNVVVWEILEIFGIQVSSDEEILRIVFDEHVEWDLLTPVPIAQHDHPATDTAIPNLALRLGPVGPVDLDVPVNGEQMAIQTMRDDSRKSGAQVAVTHEDTIGSLTRSKSFDLLRAPSQPETRNFRKGHGP